MTSDWRSDWNDYDAVVAASIFGVDTPDAVEALVSAWSQQHAGAPATIATLVNSTGCAMGLALADGRRAFAKAWPSRHDPAGLAAQLQLQQAMAESGYPAPRVLSAVVELGAAHSVLMEHRADGAPADARLPAVAAAMARSMADFTRRAAAFDLPLPRPDEPGPRKVWPTPHTAGFDFDATADGADWIDAIGAVALETIRTAKGPLVPTHHDWSAKNMRMAGEAIAVLYDWDSVYAAPETIALGKALPHFPMSWDIEGPWIATPAQMRAFLAAYEAERGTLFTAPEIAEIAAAATYARAYVTRCEHCSKATPDPPTASRDELVATGPITAEMLRG